MNYCPMCGKGTVIRHGLYECPNCGRVYSEQMRRENRITIHEIIEITPPQESKEVRTP